HQYHSKIDSDLGWFFFLEGREDKIVINLKGVNYSISLKLNYSLKEYYLIIECHEKIKFPDFKYNVNAIIVSIGFFSGYYYRIEEFYFQSEDELFEKGLEFFYRSNDQKMVIYEPFTRDPIIYYREDNVEKYSSTISVEVFESLVKLLISKPNIYFALVN